MKNTIKEKLSAFSSFVEIILGIFVLLACVVSGIGIVIHTDVNLLFSTPPYFIEWLSTAYYVIIGVEFVKMIANHTLDAVIEVLLLTLARQMIVEHASPLDSLFVIVSVSLLFAVRKYLYIAKIDHKPIISKKTQECLLASEESTKEFQDEVLDKIFE